MMKRAVAAAVLAAWSCSALADSIDVSLSNKSAQFNYGQDYRRAQLDIGGLYNKDHNWFVNAGLQATGNQYGYQYKISAGIGGQVYGVSVDNYSLVALGLGGHVIYYPGRSRLGLGLRGFYAPSIVTGGDGTHFWELGASVNYEVMETASVFIGYRKVEAGIKNVGDLTVDQGGYAGVRFSF